MEINIETIKSKTSRAISPIKAISDIVINSSEKMLTLQMESAKVYSNISFIQLKKIGTISNFTQAGDFFWGQIEPFGAINKQLLTDWKSIMAFNSDLTGDLKAVFSSDSEQKSEPIDSIFTELEETIPESKTTKTKRRSMKKSTTD